MESITEIVYVVMSNGFIWYLLAAGIAALYIAHR